jgi:beta-1,3-galactosyl-O-glycosyl-glycoprotein beta-1,6-N-acetylglucosaminyltransferase/N-acetyllactosaminide beta-1,6-N-acetylglucosaminyltransferase
VHLLRAIYRPQNVYCLHVDRKAAQSVHEAMRGVARCFPNIFMASRAVSVVWGNYTVLEPEIVCLQDLVK